MTTSPSPDRPARTLLDCSAVLFDCDGVLVDSDAVVVGAWTRWAEQMGLDTGTLLATVHGRRSADTVAAFVEPEGRAAALELINAIEIELAAAVTAIPGAAELVVSIPAGRWATVTSGARDVISHRLQLVGVPVPEVLVGSEDVSTGKPDPEGYLTAARRLGVPPEQCVVVEDAPAGIHAARRAGVRYVLGVGDRDLGEHQPDLRVPDLRAVRWTGEGLEI